MVNLRKVDDFELIYELMLRGFHVRHLSVAHDITWRYIGEMPPDFMDFALPSIRARIEPKHLKITAEMLNGEPVHGVHLRIY